MSKYTISNEKYFVRESITKKTFTLWRRFRRIGEIPGDSREVTDIVEDGFDTREEAYDAIPE